MQDTLPVCILLQEMLHIEMLLFVLLMMVHSLN